MRRNDNFRFQSVPRLRYAPAGTPRRCFILHAPDGRTTASVQLYHDQSGDPVSFSRTAYLSMPLSAFDGVLTLGDTIRLRVNTFGEGEKTWTLVR